MRDEVDPETSERFTIRRYRSEKTEGESGWRHVQIALQPVNPSFDPISLAPTDDERSVEVLAELVEVVR